MVYIGGYGKVYCSYDSIGFTVNLFVFFHFGGFCHKIALTTMSHHKRPDLLILVLQGNAWNPFKSHKKQVGRQFMLRKEFDCFGFDRHGILVVRLMLVRHFYYLSADFNFILQTR